jgi:hypothetical protein
MSFRRRRGTGIGDGVQPSDVYGTRRLRSVEGSVRCSVSTAARVNQGMGADPGQPGSGDPEVCEPTPHERAAAPAVYWPRSSGVRVPGTGLEPKSHMSV